MTRSWEWGDLLSTQTWAPMREEEVGIGASRQYP